MIYFLAALLGGAIIWFVVEKQKRTSHPVTGGLKSNITLPHEEEFELYGNSFSHCSRKTRLVMAELGIPYKHKPIDLIETGAYETISPHYLKVNPAGLLPTLVHHGHPVYESDDILAYAASQAPETAPSLVPETEGGKAQMQTWIDRGSISSDDPLGSIAQGAGSCIPGLTMPIFVTAIRYIPLRNILIGLLFHPDKKRPIFFSAAKVRGLQHMLRTGMVHNLVANSRDHMVKHLIEFQDHLKQGGPWIMGDQYTLADVSWSCIFLRLDETGWLDHFFATHDFEVLEKYYAAVKARPSWQSAIVEKGHPIIDKASIDLKKLASENETIKKLLYH